MKKVTCRCILLLSCFVMMFSCTDSEKDGEGEAPVITRLPDVNIPLSAGASITIEGTGFAKDCEVELWGTAATRASQVVISVEVTQRTATSITFVAPAGVEGVYNVVIKQGGETFTVGQISLTTNPFVGRWQWLESISDSEHEYHINIFFTINPDGTGLYLQGSEIISVFEWDADGEAAINIRFTDEKEGETLHLTVKESTGNRMTLQYEADGVVWLEILQRSQSGGEDAPVVSPLVSTGDSREITDKTAVCSGIYLGRQAADEVGICYSSTSKEPRVADGKVSAKIGSEEMFSAQLIGLEMDKLYYWRPYAVVKGVTYYGGTATFKTIGIWTVDVQNVTFTSAKCSGSVTSIVNTSKYGICYSSEKAEPTVADSKKETDINGVNSYGRFEMTFSDLTPGKLYHYRAYQILEGGTVMYGEVKDFLTAGCVTGSSYPTEDTAICIGQYVEPTSASDTPEEFGIYYGIENMVKMPAAYLEPGSGAFRVSLSGLEANKTYKYQAYVMLGGETYYGEVRTFVTKKSLYGTWQRTSFVSYDRKSGSETWTRTPETDNDFVVTYHKDGTCVIAHGAQEIGGVFTYDEATGRLSTTYGEITERGTCEMNADRTYLKFSTDIKTETVDGAVHEHYAVTEWNKISDEEQ